MTRGNPDRAFKKYAIVLVLLLLIGTLSVLSPQFF
jgi:hypothetical protein